MSTLTASIQHGVFEYLIEDLPDVGFRLSEPHGEQLGSLDRDEVRLTLVGNRFGKQRLTATCQHIGKNMLPKFGKAITHMTVGSDKNFYVIVIVHLHRCQSITVINGSYHTMSHLKSDYTPGGP